MMPLKRMISVAIGRAENRLGVALDYTRKIAETDLGLLMRYNKIFGFLDANRKVPPLAYHAARLRGAIASDCGTCIAAEINLAKAAKIQSELIDQIISGSYAEFPKEIAAAAILADQVVGLRQDAPEHRETIRQHFGDAGLIELSFAMNGAALLPGIKRAMGYAVACDMEIVRKLVKAP